MEEQQIAIALGTLSGVQLLSGRGPDVHLRVEPAGYLTSEVENRFESAGINQTRHQIMLLLDMRVMAIIPGYTTSTEIHTEYCLAETVIVGTVPDTLLTLSGKDSSFGREVYDLESALYVYLFKTMQTIFADMENRVGLWYNKFDYSPASGYGSQTLFTELRSGKRR